VKIVAMIFLSFRNEKNKNIHPFMNVCFLVFCLERTLIVEKSTLGETCTKGVLLVGGN